MRVRCLAWKLGSPINFKRGYMYSTFKDDISEVGTRGMQDADRRITKGYPIRRCKRKIQLADPDIFDIKVSIFDCRSTSGGYSEHR